MFFLAGWISRQQLIGIEYVNAKNRMLRDADTLPMDSVARVPSMASIGVNQTASQVPGHTENPLGRQIPRRSLRIEVKLF